MWANKPLQPSPTEPALPPGASHHQSHHSGHYASHHSSGSGKLDHGSGSSPNQSSLSRNLEVRVLRLLDMPRAYEIRRPKGYIIKAISDDDREIARSGEIEGFQGYTPDGLRESNEDIEHVELRGNEGILRLETSARLIFIQVEYSTGELIGRCHIHRLDPRSSKPWPYLLSDLNGNTVNCGIELAIIEGAQQDPQQSFDTMKKQDGWEKELTTTLPSYEIGGALGGSPGLLGLGLGIGLGPAATEMPSSRSLLPTPIFGDVPNLLDVVRGRPPMQVGMGAAPLGATVSAVSASNAMHPQVMSLPRSHPAPLPRDYEIWHPPEVLPGEYPIDYYPNSREYPAAIDYYPNAREYPAAIDYYPNEREYPARFREYPTRVFMETPPQDLSLALPPPDDGLQELWCAPPPPAASDSLFGSDMDLEVRARNSEAWLRPLQAHDAPLFEKNLHPERFPDMNVSLTKRFDDRQHMRADQHHVEDRAKESLPEFSFDRWVDNKTRQLALPAPQPPPPQFSEADPPQAPRPPASNAPPPAVRRPQGKVRVENILVTSEQLRKMEQQCNDARLVQLDKDLVPKDFLLQLVGCVDFKEPASAEKRVWVRTPTSLSTSSRTNAEAMLQQMGTDQLEVAVTCQKGHRGFKNEGEISLPNQDNYSMTRLDSDIAIYVICDGHGPFGHLVSFRIVQSLPKFVLSELMAPGGSAEQALLKGFQAATVDLAAFARETQLDISASGASCVAVLRRGPNVQIAWVGDSGALVGSLLEQEDAQQVDLMTRLHTTDSPQELVRIQKKGAEVRPVMPHNVPRIFRPGTTIPGVFVTRAFGIASLEDYGVSWQPDIKRTSFESMPGVVLLGSGGLWEVTSRGEAVLNLLSKSGLHPGGGPQQTAVMQLSELAQRIWRKEEEGFCFDDITCMLLHWKESSSSRPPMIQGDLGAVPPEEPSGSRTKPTTLETPLSAEEIESQFNEPGLVSLDPALCPQTMVVQVVGCLEVDEVYDLETPVWLRKQGDASIIRVDGGSKEWLEEFSASNITVGAISRKGKKFPGVPAPNQDNFSITSAEGGRAVYVVCDGHGPLGHLAAFRVVQSIPNFILAGLSSPQFQTADSDKAAESAVLNAFRAAASDLVSFSAEQKIDLSASGTTCAVVLRDGDKVHVARLGDTRALIATVLEKTSRLDMLTQAHTPAMSIERRRLQEGGLMLRQAQPGGPVLISEKGMDGPQLTVSRAFGDFKFTSHGLISVPDVTKTTMAGVPGIVLLASGGMCELLLDGTPGETMLDLISRRGKLLERGADHALKCLCEAAQERWQEEEGEYCEDISGILIHWSAPLAPAARPPTDVYTVDETRTPQSLTVSNQPYSILSAMPRTGGMPMIQEESQTISSSSWLSAAPGTQAISSTSVRPSHLSAAVTSQKSGQVLSSPSVLNAVPGGLAATGSSQGSQASPARTFLQADPQQGSALKISGSSAQAKAKSFLQAEPVGSTKPVQRQQALSASSSAPSPSASSVTMAGPATTTITAAPRGAVALSAALNAAPSSASPKTGLGLSAGYGVSQGQLTKTPLSQITANAPSKLARVPE